MEKRVKVCKICHVEKPLTDFYKNKNADGRFNSCKICEWKKVKEFRKNPFNEEKIKSYRRKHHLKNRYGISIDTFNHLRDIQMNRCMICGLSPPLSGKKKNQILHIDHCHKTGNVRGLLCYLCNRGIGMFKEDITLLEKAIDYLAKS